MPKSDIELVKIHLKTYVTIPDAAEYIGCEEQSVRYHIRKKKITSIRTEACILAEWDSVQQFAVEYNATKGERTRYVRIKNRPVV